MDDNNFEEASIKNDKNRDIVLKRLDPPFGSNSDIFEIGNILTAADPLGDTLKKAKMKVDPLDRHLKRHLHENIAKKAEFILKFFLFLMLSESFYNQNIFKKI